MGLSLTTDIEFPPIVPFVGAPVPVPVITPVVDGVPLLVAGIPPTYKPKVPNGAFALPEAPLETALILALLDFHCAYTVMSDDTDVA